MEPADNNDSKQRRNSGPNDPRNAGPGGQGPHGQRGGAPEGESSEWKEKVIQIRRVTKVVKGGKKLSFRAVVVVGNGGGQVGIGIGKSSEVIGAIQRPLQPLVKPWLMCLCTTPPFLTLSKPKQAAAW